MPIYDANIAFGRTDEEYLGTWFGYDAWSYVSHGGKSVLLVEGNNPGDYRTWVGGTSWFYPDARIGQPDGSSMPLWEHLTTTEHGKAFLMAFAMLYHQQQDNKQ